MAASRPSWIWAKFWKDVHYPTDIQIHHTKYENNPSGGFWDTIDVKIQYGRQSAILDAIKILKKRASPHWYTESPYQIWKRSDERLLRYDGRRTYGRTDGHTYPNPRFHSVNRSGIKNCFLKSAVGGASWMGFSQKNYASGDINHMYREVKFGNHTRKAEGFTKSLKIAI